MLPLFGQPVHVEGNEVRLTPAGALTAPGGEVAVPADPSSASFFAVAASLVAGSDIRLRGVGINPCRDGWRRILKSMGGKIDESEPRLLGEEPVADLGVAHAAVCGVDVNPSDVPDAIDEFPILFVAAALADGEFVLDGAEELRVKESDRIACMATALSACGAEIEETPGGVRIRGVERLRGGVSVDAKGDHRIAMAMAVAAQQADNEIQIRGAGAIATSFPDFVDMARSSGMNVRWAD
jgi:3-phosphoshikimate 1-carboxyvinyltransferase